MNPRGWQNAAVAWALQTPGHRLIQAPPGCGKSYVGYAVAAAWLRTSVAHRVIWAAPSIALLEQARAAAWRYLKIPAFACRAEVRAPFAARCVITTHQSAIRFLAHARATDLLVFDEAHHANQHALANIATCARHTQCLGLSASPWSPGCKQAFPQRWVYPLSEALADGALLPLIVHPELPRQSVPQTLHFVETVAAARAAAAAGRALCFVQGDPMSQLSVWLRGRVHDLYACGRLGEGYDVPACARVVIHRQTRSAIWIYQAVGRVLRCRPDKRHGHAYRICDDTQVALQQALALADGYLGSLADSQPQPSISCTRRATDLFGRPTLQPQNRSTIHGNQEADPTDQEGRPEGARAPGEGQPQRGQVGAFQVHRREGPGPDTPGPN